MSHRYHTLVALKVPLPQSVAVLRTLPHVSLPYGLAQKQSSQMARKKKNAERQTNLAGAVNQPRREPPAFENIILGVTPNYRSSYTGGDYHYPGTRRSRFQDQDRPDGYRDAAPSRWQPKPPVSRELSAPYRPAEPRNAAVSTWYSGSLLSREPPDQYRPGDSTRASWNIWRQRPSAVQEANPVTPDYVAGSVLGDPQPPFLDTARIPKSNHRSVNAATLPTPSRSGTIEIRPLWQAGDRDRASLRKQTPFTGNNGISSTWRPDPTTPSYAPPRALPLGVQTSSRIQVTNGFTAYQPLRFTHTANTRSDWAEDEEARILSQERWTGSVTQRTAQHPLRSDQVGTSVIAQQRSFETPQPEISNYRRDNILKPLPIPKPTTQYLQRANLPPLKSTTLRPLLLVIDLNGTLVDRKRRTSSFVERPNLAPFLSYVLANHALMIWSSAQPENVRNVCQRLFSAQQRRKVIGEWGRDTLDLTPAQYREKVQVYKRLDKIWRNDTIRESHPDADRGGVWDQSNTVLIDDSRLKAAAQPHNLLEIPEFKNTPEQRGTDVLGQVVGYLEELRLQEDVSRFIRQRSFRVDDGWARPWRQVVQGKI